MGVLKSRASYTALIGYCLLAVAIAIYALLLYFSPQANANSNNSLGLSRDQINLLKLTIILPYITAWALAVYGLTTLKRYTTSTKDLEEGFVTLLNAVHKGLAWIVAGMVLAAIIGALRPFLVSLPYAPQVLTIIVNYLYILPLMIGFWIMYQGAKRMQIVRRIEWPQWRADNIIKTVIVLVLVGFYVFLTFTNPSRSRTYALPDIAIILTIIIPMFITWWLGFSVAFIMSDLIPRVTRANLFKAMTRFLFGIWSIIFTSILLQAIFSLGSARLMSLGLGLILAIVYLFVILHGISYLFVALGVKNLKRVKPMKKATTTA